MAANDEIIRALARNRAAVQTYIQAKGASQTRKFLYDSQRELEKRLARSLTSTGPNSFTSTQLKSALEQVKAVLRDTTVPAIHKAVLGVGGDAARIAGRETVEYLRRAHKAFTGVVTSLPIREASVFDRAVIGSRASVVRHLQSTPGFKGRKPLLERYSDAVVNHFENVFGRGVLLGKSQIEMREEVRGVSPFLNEAPASWATRLVRTEVHGAYNRAAHESMKEVNAQLGGGMIRILCATFDDRTGSDSVAVHGQVRGMDEPFSTWYGDFQTPPDRPNDREIVVPHRLRWPIPDTLKPKGDDEVLARWKEERRKGSPPSRPLMSTVDEIKYLHYVQG